MSHSNAKPPHDMDLSAPWQMRTEHVARLLGISEDAVRKRVFNGTIDVLPRVRGRGKTMVWSSLDWWKWFNGRK
jgi:hypothetical protein